MPTLRLAITFALGLVAACQMPGPCDYSLSQHGWVPDASPPSDVVAESSGWRSARFFRNVAGEVLVCPNHSPRDYCGGVYSIYESVGSGYTLKDTIACTT